MNASTRRYNPPISLRQFRNARGLSLRQLEQRASVNRAYLSQIETGLRAPTAAQMVAIADALEIPLERCSVRLFMVVEA